MTTTARRLRLGSTRARVALACVAALVLFVWAFDAIWLRPLIQHHVLERSGRRIGFVEFLKVGVPVTLLSMVMVTGYLFLRYV